MTPVWPWPLKELALEMHKANAGSEELLAKLRGAGASPIQCVGLLHEIYGMPLQDAKRVLHESEAWQDQRAIWDRLHEDIEQALVDKHREGEETD
jgi:ribosomal protein L22